MEQQLFPFKKLKYFWPGTTMNEKLSKDISTDFFKGSASYQQQS
jgi:hypothetical protein